MRSRYLLLCLTVVFGSICHAKTNTSNLKDTLTIENALSRYNLGTPVISPDGSKAIVPVTQIGSSPNLPATHLWMLDIETKTLYQFTSSAKSETNPKWSPDSKQLAFLSGRNGKSQIFLIGMQGGEALQLTQSKTAINAFEWNPKNNSIAYTTEDDLTDSVKKRQEDKFDEKSVGESDQPARLYTIDVTTKKTKLLIKQNWDIHEFNWMPAGDALLLVMSNLPSAEINPSKLIKFNLPDSTITNLAAPDHGFWNDLTISPDGKTALFSSARSDGPTPHDLFIHQLSSNKFKNITEKSLDRAVGHVKFTDNNTVLALVQMGFNVNLYTIKGDGTATPYPLKDNIQSFDISANGTIVYVKGGYSQLPELYLAKSGNQSEKVSDFNKSFANITLIEPRVFTYKSFDGKVIEGALFKPAGSTDGKLLPMIAYIHGGPTGAFSNSYSAWVQLLVQKGYAVFCPNIRGSTGYGWDFVTSNRKDWGGSDYKDMMAGIDYLIANEHIDPNRLGISGWSYGGYMAEWAITQTHRFKASVSGAGMANLASEFGTESGPDYDHWFWGSPYENLDLFYKHSPIAFLKNATTPTLIIQGEDDTTDPIGQGQELYRGLHYYHVPTELILYPREPHGFREMNHNIDFYRRMLLWFAKYLN